MSKNTSQTYLAERNRGKNSSKTSRGVEAEKILSKNFHDEGIPICIHPSFLRSRNAGQVDLCRIKKRKKEICIEVQEVKSSYLIHRKQMKRLKESCQLLSIVFNLNCYLGISFGSNKSHNKGS